jgi:hypothetical protein
MDTYRTGSRSRTDADGCGTVALQRRGSITSSSEEDRAQKHLQLQLKLFSLGTRSQSSN